MKNTAFKYGKSTKSVSIAIDNWLDTIESSLPENSNLSEEEIILNALKYPIGSQPLKDKVLPGEKVCIVISDITRSWQRMQVYLRYIVDELEKGGVKDEDITFLCATGSHRKQTKEEHRILIGEKLFHRFEVIDHDCHDSDNHVYMGTTSFGTPVKINKVAVSCDHLIITGAVIFHDLAGWGGGKKSILPGISAYESIMANHALSLSPSIGKGTHTMVKRGNIIHNPLHEDMVEAVNLVKPSFLFNVIINEQGRIGGAVAGHYLKAHEAGRKMVDEIDGVFIKEKADLVIVSAGGYPKDINLYQASKAISNAKEALKDKGTMILVAECSEGIGDSEMQEIIDNFNNNTDREIFLRENFSVTRYIAYLMAELAEKFDIILVSDMSPGTLSNIGIKIVSTVEEALDYSYIKKGKHLATYLMPNGSNTLPKLV